MNTPLLVSVQRKKWIKGIWAISCSYQIWLREKCEGDDASPNKRWTRVSEKTFPWMSAGGYQLIHVGQLICVKIFLLAASALRLLVPTKWSGTQLCTSSEGWSLVWHCNYKCSMEALIHSAVYRINTSTWWWIKGTTRGLPLFLF